MKAVIVTGAAGFIGSCLVSYLNRQGITNIILVDDFTHSVKQPNYVMKEYHAKINREQFPEWLLINSNEVEFIYHIGARTDTTESDWDIFETLNVNYSKKIWNICAQHGIPLIYASSAATYGLGENGYSDNHGFVPELKPLNPYGQSKQVFDEWVLEQNEKPPFWAGLKFFNVYGPNEYHKGRMASVILHAHNQIRETGIVKLFKSHNTQYEHGKQLRDFIYVKDVLKIIRFLSDNRPDSGLYNIGTGNAETFLTLAESTFQALGIEPKIEFIDTPLDIRDKYQYFTEADMGKLHLAGYTEASLDLKAGVQDYVQNYLRGNQYY